MSQQRNRQLARWFHVIALLRAYGGISLERLASETGVTSRTIRRDLAGLQDAGVPVWAMNEHTTSTQWRLVRGCPCPVCGRAPLKGAELRRELDALTRNLSEGVTR